MASKHLWDTKISSNDSTAREQLGILRKEWCSTDSCFKTYKYVQASLTAAASNGICLAWYAGGAGGLTSTATLNVATDDISTTKQNLPAGVCTGTLSDGNYGWIQVGGYHSAVDTDGNDDIVKGDLLHLSATDGKCYGGTIGVASTYKLLGVAVADDVDASDTVAALLNCTYAGSV